MAIDKFELTRKITEELNEEIGVPTIFIFPNKSKETSLTSSKFGGLPYWDKSLPYPTDKDGNKLKLLAQFNLGEISETCESDLGLLPNEGMLQFFLLAGEDNFYGSDLDDATNNNNFRVVYHPVIKEGFTVKDAEQLQIPTFSDEENDYEPIRGETGLDFSLEKKASPDYGAFNEKFIEKAAKYGWRMDTKPEDINDLYEFLESEVGDELYECAYIEENCLLGYPVFAQYDPRDEEDYPEYDTQLFQMVSSSNEEDSDFMESWGDMGMAHFFINHHKLIEIDFSDIMYYWDCY